MIRGKTPLINMQIHKIGHIHTNVFSHLKKKKQYKSQKVVFPINKKDS